MDASASPTQNLSAVEPTGNALAVSWADGAASTFHNIWLRDNCRCESCGEPETGRRQLRLSTIPLDIRIASADVTPDNALEIQWTDGHVSRYGGNWLRACTYDDGARRRRGFAPQVWTNETRTHPPVMDFTLVDTEDRAFLTMLQTVRDLGICILRDAPTAPDTLEGFAQKIGPIQESNFGRVLNLVVDDTKRSVANRTVALKPHTDEPYRASPPGLLLFHCIETDVTGAGSSIFVDGFELAETLRAEDPEGFAALTRNNQSFRRYFEGDVDLIAEFPVLSVDEFGHLTGVRINDRVAAPLSIPPEQVEIYYRGLKRLLQLCEDPAKMIHLTLRPGDVAVFDNHRILHGRTELTMNGRRWLQWLQVERGDFHSALRILADRLGDSRNTSPYLRGAYS